MQYNIIHPETKIGIGTRIRNFVEIREGVTIGNTCYVDSGVCITGDAKIGDNVTLRNYVVVARGSQIGNNTFIAPRVMFNNIDAGKNSIGGAKIGENCFIGTGSVLHHGITICDNVTIGAMSFVNKDITEPGVYIGTPAKKVKGKNIHPTAQVHEDVKIGENVYIGPGCVIGYPAEDKKHWPDNKYSVIIKDGATITGNVTIDGGTIQHTVIGKDTFIMKGVHIGHDANIGGEVTIACHSLIGGGVKIFEGANIGLGAIIHQNQKIGHYSMLGMGTVVTKKSKIEPCKKYVKSPAKVIGINQIAIDRNNIKTEDVLRYIKEFNA